MRRVHRVGYVECFGEKVLAFRFKYFPSIENETSSPFVKPFGLASGSVGPSGGVWWA